MFTKRFPIGQLDREHSAGRTAASRGGEFRRAIHIETARSQPWPAGDHEEGVVVLAEGGMVLFASPLAGRMLGCQPERIVGRPLRTSVVGGQARLRVRIEPTTWGDKQAMLIAIRHS